mmetsp:Transcript_19683/g.29581  ORF Transcript_19683/g.29581 Transcript_19683/m.29581 type:complete len:317 (-) Transcript_19683:39-989(-)
MARKLQKQSKQPKMTRKDKSFISKRDIKKDDILLGRGRCRFKNPGNIAYRAFVESRLPIYFKGNRKEKSRLVLEIITSIKEHGSRFLKSEGSLWLEVDTSTIREKVGHSIRDAVRLNDSFQYQERMRNIFDENSEYHEIVEYVMRNNNSIMTEISDEQRKRHLVSIPVREESTTPINENISENVVSDEDTAPSVLSDDDSSSIEDSEMLYEGEMPQLKAGQSSVIRSSFVSNFVSKLNKEAEEIADVHLLENRRALADNFRIISLASIHDWVEFHSCSKHSDNEWSDHLSSLVSCTLDDFYSQEDLEIGLGRFTVS